MIADIDKLEDELLQLPNEARARLAATLHSSLVDPEIDDNLDREIAKRIENYRLGKSVPLTSEEVDRRAMAVINDVRSRSA